LANTPLLFIHLSCTSWWTFYRKESVTTRNDGYG
jgi:hypothetical protein